jgi:8-oxo-dGTP pyrophosphatase MutT (NUDIX family)
MQKSYLDLLDELRSIAQIGLNYVKNPYDEALYTRLLNLASDQYSEITGLSSETIKERFAKELGYITPKVGAQCVLFNEKGELLLEQRADDGMWGLPAGWVDTGETPAMAIVRELMEEAQLDVEAVKVIGFCTRLPGEWAQPHTSIHITYLCRYISGTIVKSHESLQMGYYDPLSITGWHKDHGIIVNDVLNGRMESL